MWVIEKLRAAVLAAILPAVLCAGAQDKDFKQHWSRLEAPIYYQCQLTADKMPAGSVIFGMFGFDRNKPLEADFFLSGNILTAEHADKTYTFVIERATLRFTDNIGQRVVFNGDLRVNIERDKKKQTIFTFWPGSGMFTLDGHPYRLIEEGIDYIFWNTGWMQLTVSADTKTKPQLYANFTDLNLPRAAVLDIPARPGALAEYLTGRTKVKVKGADLANKVLRNPARADLSMFPEYKEHVTQYYYKDLRSVIRNVTDSVDLGEKIVTPDYEVRALGDAVNIDMRMGNARFVDDVLQFANWTGKDGIGVFRNDTLFRYDGSMLAGFRFAEPTAPGYLINRLGVIMALADPELYDFNDACLSSGLTIASYRAPGTHEWEPITNNTIASIKNFREVEQSHIGPDRTLADVRGHAKWVKTRTSLPNTPDQYVTFDYDGYFTGPVGNCAGINQAFAGDGLQNVMWDVIGHDAKAVATVPSAQVGGLDKEFAVMRNGSGYICEVATSSTPGDDEYEGSTVMQWQNNRLAKSWMKGWEDEPTRYTYDRDGRLVAEVYESDDVDPGKYTWKYEYTAFDDHGNWTTRTVHFTYEPTGDAKPADQTWTETRTYRYF